MTPPNTRMTKLELALLGWTALSIAIGLWVLLNAPSSVYGSGPAIFAFLVPVFLVALLLVWLLFDPTRGRLLFGAVFWALQIVVARSPDFLYGYRLGLGVNFKLIDGPSFVVQVNLLAIVVAYLFVKAALRRPGKPSGATSR